ncbi:MAG: hypothetical protein NC390_03960 [Fusobacterium sp.]|nr:hypothetical protein [Fusobacterium sp.]
MMFIIIAILGYLLSYRLTSYLADFKVEKHYSRIDIAFLAVCALIMYLPMSHISNAQKSDLENRNLAVWKPLIKNDGSISFNFGRDYDRWFSDRFNFRDSLVTLYKDIKYSIAIDYVDLGRWHAYKSNKFVFGNGAPPVYPEKQKVLITSNLERFEEFCNKSGKKLYVIISPIRESVYRDFDKIRVSDDSVEVGTTELVDYIRSNSNVNVIFPQDTLLKNRKTDNEILFYKTDHHLTDTGAYLLYNDVITTLKKDFPLLKITSLSDYHRTVRNLVRWKGDRLFDEGWEYLRSKMHDKSFLETLYVYYDYKYPERIDISGKHPHYKHYNKFGKYKTLIIGDSYQENLSYFLNTSFKEIDKYRLDPNATHPLHINAYDKIISDSDADMVLLIVHSPYTRFFRTMFNGVE